AFPSSTSNIVCRSGCAEPQHLLKLRLYSISEGATSSDRSCRYPGGARRSLAISLTEGMPLPGKAARYASAWTAVAALIGTPNRFKFSIKSKYDLALSAQNLS